MEYKLEGNYGYGWDTLTIEATRAEAEAQLNTYRVNDAQVIGLRIKRVRVNYENN